MNRKRQLSYTAQTLEQNLYHFAYPVDRYILQSKVTSKEKYETISLGMW